jgi:hypothetical protein
MYSPTQTPSIVTQILRDSMYISFFTVATLITAIKVVTPYFDEEYDVLGLKSCRS